LASAALVVGRFAAGFVAGALAGLVSALGAA
jgi:hypothetical protein